MSDTHAFAHGETSCKRAAVSVMDSPAKITCAQPDALLCERVSRIMSVYAGLADDVVSEAWNSCFWPRQVPGIVREAAAWEAWVTAWRVFRGDDLAELQLLHAQHMHNLRALDLRGSLGPKGPLRLSTGTVLRCTPRLTRLEVMQFEISGPAMASLEPAFTHMYTLKKLHMSDCDIMDVDAAAALARCLSHVRCLVDLKLRFACLDDAAMCALEPGFTHLSHLQSLYFGWNPLGPGGAASLARSLRHTRDLVSLNLMRTSMHGPAMAALSPGFEHLSRLRELNISLNRIGPEGAPSLSHCLSCARALTSIDLERTDLGEAAMTALEPGFAGLSELQLLTLSKNPLGPGAASLARCLSNTPALRELRISKTEMDGPAMRSLEPGFTHLSQLDTLDISCNALGAEGAASLARALARTPALSVLIVTDTLLDAPAMAALQPGFVHVPRLSELHGDRNRLGADGIACLCVCLTAVRRLTLLDVRHTDADEAAKEAIRTAAPQGCDVHDW